MISIIVGIATTILLMLSLLFYYAGEEARSDIPAASDGQGNNFWKRTKEQYFVIAIAGVMMIATLLIGQFVYHAEILYTLKWQVAAGLIIPIAAIDRKAFVIPNKLLITGFVFSVLIYAVQCFTSPTLIFTIMGNSMVGALVGGGIFFIASVFVKNGVGAGDIKLFLWLGFLLAFRGVFNVLLYSMVISAVSSIVLLLLKKKTLKDELPLAPFAMAGVIISICFGV